jgi:hypothetical protein
VHGNRMVRIQPNETQIIDLDRQTITTINNARHEYYTVTFAQLQQAFEEAQQKAKEQSQQQKTETAGSEPPPQVSFHANITSSGASKQIEGREAKEALLTLTMDAQSTDGSNAKGSLAVTSEMWMIPDAPGYEEVRQFQMRLAKALASNIDISGFASMMNAQPGAQQAMSDLAKESEKMKGIPVLSTLRMGVSADGKPLPTASEATTTAASNNASALGAAAKDGATSGAEQTANDQIAKLGGLGHVMTSSALGSFMRHKKNQPAPSDTSSQSAGSTPSSATLLESFTRRFNFSDSPVDPTSFEIPASYKLVEAPEHRAAGVSK